MLKLNLQRANSFSLFKTPSPDVNRLQSLTRSLKSKSIISEEIAIVT